MVYSRLTFLIACGLTNEILEGDHLIDDVMAHVDTMKNIRHANP